MEFESSEEATRAVAALDRQPLLPEASKRFVRLEQVLSSRRTLRCGGNQARHMPSCLVTLPAWPSVMSLYTLCCRACR